MFKAFLAMLNSCASGVTVVSIHHEERGANNGFGAGYAASLINQLVGK